MFASFDRNEMYCFAATPETIIPTTVAPCLPVTIPPISNTMPSKTQVPMIKQTALNLLSQVQFVS